MRRLRHRRLRHRRLRDRDDGQLLLLVIGLAVIAAMLVTVVTNVSKVFLWERSLASAADGAAVAASSAVDEPPLYAGRTGERLPLSPDGAGARVAAYVAGAGLAERFGPRFEYDVAVENDTVTVTFTAPVDLVFVNLVSSAYADGYPMSVTASARSPLRG
jgi:uncharacterized membrane protein